jgi:uncharacterized protein YcbK (DUF882 family)
VDKLSEHFKASEFRCHCGKCEYAKEDPPMNEGFLDNLEELRSKLGDKPMGILSGYRCKEYNKQVGGAPESQHMVLPCQCADITVKQTAPRDVADAAEELFNGLGRYTGWTHVDTRPNKSRWKGQGL